MLNMGGPIDTDKVPEYLLRIMTDRDMIQLPVQRFGVFPIDKPIYFIYCLCYSLIDCFGTYCSQLGPWIAKRRAPDVQKKYAEIGGGSPILKWTNLQGKLLCEQLDKVSPESAPHKHYVAFRYADPLTEETLQRIEE